jgi:hypothetical protein
LGLAVAAASPGLFFTATNLMEPLFAAILALGGLAFVARRAASPDSDARARRKAVLASVAVIAAASFLYQGVILAVGLIPIFLPRSEWRDKRTLLASAAILAMVPLASACVLEVAGNSLGHSLSRITQGEENELYRSYLKKSGVTAYLVALLGGPPQAVIGLPAFRGFNGLLAALRTPGERSEAAGMVLRLAFGLTVVAAGLFVALRRRDFGLLLGFGALMLLPLVRHQQYGYVKYYVLFPVLLAIGAARAPMPIGVGVAIVMLAVNGCSVLAEVAATRSLYRQRQEAYAQADARSCWISSGWGPGVGFLWPGSVCPILGTVAGGEGEDPSQVVAGAHTALTREIEDCFCYSSGVFTDDFDASEDALLTETAQHFQYADIDLPRITLLEGHGTLVSRGGGRPVFRYSDEDQRRACDLATAAARAR